VTEEFPKPRYEAPILIDLGGMAKGRGQTNCTAGPLDTGTFCTAGGSNPLACTAGTAAFNACTDQGVAAHDACTFGPVAVLACTTGGAETG
jgi:hypothetical protein